MLLNNSTEPEEPHSSVVRSGDLEAIEPELNEHHEARNQPTNPVLRPKSTPQDATSNRITLDF